MDSAASAGGYGQPVDGLVPDHRLPTASLDRFRKPAHSRLDNLGEVTHTAHRPDDDDEYSVHVEDHLVARCLVHVPTLGSQTRRQLS